MTGVAPIVIKACLNGNRAVEEWPSVPLTPDDVAAEAAQCAEAGASVVHVHARDADGGSTQDAAWYDATTRLIRERCPVLVSHTTGRCLDEPVEVVVNRLENARFPPDLVSVNLGGSVRWKHGANGGRDTVTAPNTHADIVDVLNVCARRGVAPEPAVHDFGMLNNLVTLVDEGALPGPHYVLVEPVATWGDGRQAMPGDVDAFLSLLRAMQRHYPNAGWVAHGMERPTYDVIALAIVLGGHVRIGFEDAVALPDGTHPESNAEFVTWAAKVAAAYGRRPATPDEARALLVVPSARASVP